MFLLEQLLQLTLLFGQATGVSQPSLTESVSSCAISAMEVPSPSTDRQVTQKHVDLRLIARALAETKAARRLLAVVADNIDIAGEQYVNTLKELFEDSEDWDLSTPEPIAHYLATGLAVAREQLLESTIAPRQWTVFAQAIEPGRDHALPERFIQAPPPRDDNDDEDFIAGLKAAAWVRSLEL